MNAKIVGAGSRTVRAPPGNGGASLSPCDQTPESNPGGDEHDSSCDPTRCDSQTSSRQPEGTDRSKLGRLEPRAGKRAQRIGVANASSDKQIAAQLRQAERHASRALAAARHPRRRHRVVRTTTIVTGAGALGGAAYAGWRAYVQPQHPAQTEAQATHPPGSMAADPSSPQTPDNGATSTTETSETENDVE